MKLAIVKVFAADKRSTSGTPGMVKKVSVLGSEVAVYAGAGALISEADYAARLVGPGSPDHGRK